MLKAIDFLHFWSSWVVATGVVLLLSEGAQVATSVATGGNLRVTFLLTNRIEIFEQVSKFPLPFSFFLSFVAAQK